MPTVIPPVDKLPLAVRKQVRDGFDSKKADLEANLSKLLGVPWKIDINPNAIWVYAAEDDYAKTNLGYCIEAYVSSAFNSIKYFLEDMGHGQPGKDEINSVCSNHTLTMAMDEAGKISYCGCDVHEGMLRILFNPKYLGTNHNDALQKLEDVLSTAASSSSLSYSARHSIEESWDKNIPEIQAKVAKHLKNPAIKLNPNWEEVFAALRVDAAVKAEEGWDKRIGMYMKAYFEAFAYALEYNKFEEDEMLREGFEEVVSKGEVKFRIVKELTPGGYYNESVVEDGILYMQTQAKNWGVNNDTIATKIVDIL
ncbi:uncharacterized protein BDR25DRAFT_335751 [Lindgomyces ingoldianus]|uniref:Uncharacterized protein n=1 Tax=Lindgomyces ingoldianus TaxID=673940 RepID=A0ACB6QLT8_9PLEO|nr:uncharacterized protein BDR25DRAFT_335751 [Lindgomyces ingoldianus]KAF2467949.1 hypothetical protein BDR25DRAFT_335751 [Lindgomyces ingoldianus]